MLPEEPKPTTPPGRPEHFRLDRSTDPPTVAECDLLTWWFGWKITMGICCAVGLVLLGAMLMKATEEPPALPAGPVVTKGYTFLLHIDDLTGCHYLAISAGGLTPRLDAQGRHVCTGQEGGGE